MAIKQLTKEVDSVKLRVFFRNFMRAVPLFSMIGYALAGFPGLVVGIMTGVGSALTTESIPEKRADGPANQGRVPGRRSDILRGQLALDLNQVRFHKICRRFDVALSQIEDILAKDPEFQEALFLKAQLLWEGFEDREGAGECLLKIVEVEPDQNAVFYRWALHLYRELDDKL